MNINQALKQQGFSLIEIMVGLVVGLLAALVILNVFNVFEQQKRSTSGNSDAQTNGAIALFNMQRDLQMAGYGLPVYGPNITPYNCPINTTVNHDNNAATAAIGLSPVVITDGGAAGSDVISIHYGDSIKGGIPVSMEAAATNVVQVDSNLGCSTGEIALVMSQIGTSPALNCSMTRVTAVSAVGVTPVTVTLTASTPNVAVGNSLACLGVWNEIQYAVINNQFTRSGAIVAGVPSVAAAPIVPDVVNIQAQYGISAVGNNNRVTQWVNATGVWATTALTPTIANRNRIKAIRVAVVARNGYLQNANITATCSSLTTANPIGLCAWDGASTGSAAPSIDLSADANWQRYRYRVYESIIPIKMLFGLGNNLL